MPNRYWVGGTAAWDGTAGTKWAETSGGAGGFSVPTTTDDVFFDANSSGTVTLTIFSVAKSLNCTGFTGAIAGNTASTVNGSVTLDTGMTWTATGTVIITGSGTLTTFGKVFSAVTINGSGITVQLGDALNLVTRTLTVTAGTFTTNNYSVTAGSLSSSSSNTRTINFGSSTVILSASGTGPTVQLTGVSALTFDAGTSQLNLTNAAAGINSGGVTFYNVSFTSTALSTPAISVGSNTFNNLTVAGRATAGVAALAIGANQTINGTLTLSSGANATCRTFLRSDTIGTTRTLTCAAVDSISDIDFRDITIAGAAAPVSGTRLGDCKGNSGITFPAPKTVYWRVGAGGNWGPGSGTVWALTPSGSSAEANFPLAQDTAVFTATLPDPGGIITINAAYNIGTIDMSARTSNTMTLATGSNTPVIYGDWINGTGTTLSGTQTLTFAGRGTQTITSAGKTFTQLINVNSPSGLVSLQDAFVNNNVSANTVIINNGTFNANGFNFTLSGSSSSFNSSNSNIRTVEVGSGTWTIAGLNGWATTTSTNLTVTGTGTINLTSASAKTFAGGGIQTYPTLNQGGAGTLTVSGSNKFAGLTNTAIGRIQFVGGTTNEFGAFNVNGVSGNLLQIGSTNTTQATLKKPGAWNVGANSTDAGNNTGLSFTGSSPDYLSVSYINGVATAAPTSSIFYGSTNITSMSFGGTAVTAAYYGSTKVF